MPLAACSVKPFPMWNTPSLWCCRGSLLLVNIGRTDLEQIRSRINNNDCRTFRPRRPLSTAYKTKYHYVVEVCSLYTVCTTCVIYCKTAYISLSGGKSLHMRLATLPRLWAFMWGGLASQTRCWMTERGCSVCCPLGTTPWQVLLSAIPLSCCGGVHFHGADYSVLWIHGLSWAE